MSRLEVVIFGATGFTGKYTVIYMVEFAKKYKIDSWGVAGRSQEKLESLMLEVAKKTNTDLSGVKLIIADVDDGNSLRAMCAQAKVVVNCAGPYRMYGEPVVSAAVENKTHYVDVSGEPQFMEAMQLRYDEIARKAGVYIVSACGFDSIPVDMGITYLTEQFPGTLNSVESFLHTSLPPQYDAEAKAHGHINYGTWMSLINGISAHSELWQIRKKLYPNRLPAMKPALKRQTLRQYKDGDYYLPFPGADESVVYRTQRYLFEKENKRPIQYKAYFKSGKYFQSILSIVAALILYFMTKVQFTKNLLLKYPKLFSFGYVSKEGPTENVTKNSEFSFTLEGKGWLKDTQIENSEPDQTLTIEVFGKNPGYGATVGALLSCADTILKEQNKMPTTGGVFTPGIAFKDTSLIQKLSENGMTFAIKERN